MVKRRLKGFNDSSSDEEDAFASLGKKSKKRPSTSSLQDGAQDDIITNNNAPHHDGIAAHQDSTNTNNNKLTRQLSNNREESNLPPTETSSNKRHHYVSDARKSKMEAMLKDLQSSQPSILDGTNAVNSHNYSSGDYNEYGPIEDDPYAPGLYHQGYGRPQKLGSYVEPGQEHLTTNIFVGNLDPCTTEEELTDVFREFGDLYSVKIMWPRTAVERSRNRNTGFVCFMHRKDAEDAMDAYCDADPLETGRRMRLTWGKNVKRTVQFGTGGVPTHFRKKPRRGGRVEGLGMTSAQRSAVMEAEEVKKVHHGLSSGQNSILAEPETIEQRMDAKPVGPIYNPALHAATAIIVNAPRNPRRLRFITTIASFVAKDGSVLEQKLIEQESHNPEFQFLSPKDNGDEEQLAEHIFYRWRVYAFAQGDGFNSWRTTPFVMIQPNGRFWIPPRVDMEEAYREEEAEKRREESRVAAQEERRKMADDKDLSHMTGAQIERATGKDKRGAIKLNDWERETFHKLLRVQLCATQDSICEAMAFAFDKSGAAIEISDLLKEALLETTNGISVDTRIARLYLLSDILFNSQQPGVRNAFQYRDAIERMSPEVFESLGKHGNGKAGRMTMNRLRNAVSSVLSAWTNWSVYNTNFLDMLECRFEGREYVPPNAQKDGERAGDTHSDEAGPKEERTTDESAAAVSITPRGAWTTSSEPIDNNDVDGQALDDLDGEALDGVTLDEEERTNKPEQSAVSTVPRGQWISADDVDGNIDGEELDEDDIDGESLDDDEILN